MLLMDVDEVVDVDIWFSPVGCCGPFDAPPPFGRAHDQLPKKDRTSLVTIHNEAPTSLACRFDRRFSAIFAIFCRFTWPLRGKIPQNCRFIWAIQGKIPLIRRLTRQRTPIIAVFSRSNRPWSAFIAVSCRSNRHWSAFIASHAGRTGTGVRSSPLRIQVIRPLLGRAAKVG
jgi:hypothetical protein